MTQPAVYGGSRPPLPNEILSLIMVVVIIGTCGYFVWKIQRDGLDSFRRSAAFVLAMEIAMLSYYSLYLGDGCLR